jgi:hypothetical protein
MVYNLIYSHTLPAYRPLSQHYNNEPGQGSQYLWTHHWSQQQNVVATSERKMAKNKTMMQQIHKASARETKSMEQITLELRSTAILVP